MDEILIIGLIEHIKKTENIYKEMRDKVFVELGISILDTGLYVLDQEPEKPLYARDLPEKARFYLIKIASYYDIRKYIEGELEYLREVKEAITKEPSLYGGIVLRDKPHHKTPFMIKRVFTD